MLVLLNERTFVNWLQPNLILDERSRVYQSRINWQSSVGAIFKMEQGETYQNETRVDGSSEV